MQIRELAVLAVDLKVHGTARCSARCTSNVSDLVLKAGRQYDLGARLLTARLVANGLARHLDITGYRQSPSPAIDVHLEVDRCEHGLMHMSYRRGIDCEHGRERVGVLAAHDLEQCVSLLFAGSLIDKCQRFAIALVNGAGPFE